MLLSTDLWVSALLRRVEQAGSFAYIVHKGDMRAGSVILKIVNLKTREAIVLREAQMHDGGVWMQPIKSIIEADLDAYIEKQRKFDADLWVVEIEDNQGRTFLTEKVDLS